MLKTLRYLLEYVVVLCFFGVFKLIGVRAASWLGGFLASFIGPFTKAHQTAAQNLAKALPERATEHPDILTKMWWNLGRVFGEYPHLATVMLPKHMQCINSHVLTDNQEQGIMFFTGHYGNWELAAPYAQLNFIPMSAVFRSANNPYVDKLVQNARTHYNEMLWFRKGRKDAIKLAKHLKRGGHLGMLVDQKMREGIAVPFFNMPAQTAPALAEMALKFNKAIIPARIIRIDNKSQFELHFEQPLDTQGKSTLEIMTEVNKVLERWVHEHPEQWFWVHNRWKK